MSRLERYVSREFIQVFLLGTALYVVLFLLQTLVVRIPWLDTLPIGAIGEWLWYQVPNIAVKAFPLSVVLAALLVIGRLAREQELLAAQMAGLSLAGMVRPLIAFALLMVGMGLFLNEFVVPAANQRTKLAWWDSVDGGGIALAFVQGRQIAIGDYSLYFAAYDKPSRELREVRLETWSGANKKQQFLCFARAATIETALQPDREKRGFILLKGYACHTFDHDQLPLASQADIASFITLENIAPGQTSTLKIWLPQSRETIIARNTEGGFEDPRSLSQLWQEWREGSEPANRAAALEFSTRTAWPFASLIILLALIPLAASSTRSTGAALGLAFLVTVGYYLMLSIGQLLGQEGLVSPLLGPWLGNLLFLLLGVGLMRYSQYR